jgi:SHS2 domain-containing protein
MAINPALTRVSVTMHQFNLAQTAGGWRASVILDI